MATGLLCLLLGFFIGGVVIEASYEKKIKGGEPIIVEDKVYIAKEERLK